jgi:integrase
MPAQWASKEIYNRALSRLTGSVKRVKPPRGSSAPSPKGAIQDVPRPTASTPRSSNFWSATRAVNIARIREVSRTFQRAVAVWRGRRLDSITKADVRDLLDSIGAPAASNQALKQIKRLFNWAVAEDILKSSPLVGLQNPHPENSRDRILTDDELRRVWKAADNAGYAFGDFVKVTLLTGQRPGEVSGMGRDELHGDAWMLPAERVKNKKSHAVPLSRQAMAIIDAAPRVNDQYVFSHGAKPIRGYHPSKQTLDKASGVTGWTLARFAENLCQRTR